MTEPRNLLWRWVQVAGFATMIVALPLQSTWVFVPGVALTMLGVFNAMRIAARDPEAVRARARDGGRLGWWPANVLGSFRVLLADTRKALKSRHQAARGARHE